MYGLSQYSPGTYGSFIKLNNGKWECSQATVSDINDKLFRLKLLNNTDLYGVTEHEALLLTINALRRNIKEKNE